MNKNAVPDASLPGPALESQRDDHQRRTRRTPSALTWMQQLPAAQPNRLGAAPRLRRDVMPRFCFTTSALSGTQVDALVDQSGAEPVTRADTGCVCGMSAG